MNPRARWATCWAVAAMFVLGTAVLSRADINPVARWLFSESHFEQGVMFDEVSGCPAQLHGTESFENGEFAALQFDGENVYLSVVDPPEQLLPEERLSLEAWVSLHVGLTWGGIVGYIQDNGSFEKGWLLGYNNTAFTFSVSTEGKLPYHASTTKFQIGRWYHVVGTYDGAMRKIYVDGKLEGRWPASGAVDYPPSAFFTIGAYKDDNEFYPMSGQLHEVAVYADALDAQQVQAHFEAKSPPETGPLALELGPYVRYRTPTTAEVSWRTKQARPSILEYGLAGPGAKHSPSIELYGAHQGTLDRYVENERPKRHHVLTMTDLLPDEVYAYRIKIDDGGVERSTAVYELDTALNYSMPPMSADIELAGGMLDPEQVGSVCRTILEQTGVTKGYCLVWGLVDGALAYELAARSQLTIVGVDENAARVAAVRDRLYRAGVYGARIAVHQIESLAELPYPSNFANLIVSERVLAASEPPGQAAEMYRVLRPRDSAAALGCLPAENTDVCDAVETWLKASSVSFQQKQLAVGSLYLVQKDVGPGRGAWTHQYGDAGNTADSHDDLGGAAGTDQLEVQWLGKPGADFGIDRNPRMPAPLAAHGRLFHQGMNRMVALDAYNGAILWSLEIPSLQRVNLPRDASNWCTDDGFLYVAIKDKCWAIEHYDGALARVFDLPAPFAGDRYEWGYVARAGRRLFGSAVKENTAYTDFWGGASWYDKTSGYGTEKVCSDALFAYDLDTNDVAWTRTEGLVINTTVAVGNDKVFFVESRNIAARQAQSRRLNDAGFWADQALVALDAHTGAVVWETPIDTADGIVVFFLACTDDAVVIASSGAGKYHLYKFDADTGARDWHANHNWTSDNHSGHMQHPVVLADKVFLEPCGYDLTTGRRLTSAMGRHEGCATYCGTKNALLYRGQSRRIALWDINTGKVTSWYNLRPSCWLSTVAAEGMVLSPEGGGGCSCGNWLETSLVFAPVVPSVPMRSVSYEALPQCDLLVGPGE